MDTLNQLTARLDAVLRPYSASPVPQQFLRARSNVLLTDLFHRCCKHLHVNALVECGAHAAEASSRFMQVHGRKAVAVEANPHTFRERTQAATSKGVLALNLAVGASAGTCTLWVPNPDAAAEPTPGNASLLRRTDTSENYLSIEVEVRTVDQLVAEHAANLPLALWIDVEGMGREVLLGAASTLGTQSCLLILVEVETHRYWQDQALSHDIDSMLRESGFVAIAADAEYELQFNVLYVRSDCAATVAQLSTAYWHEAARLESIIRARLWYMKARPKVRAWLRKLAVSLLGEARVRRMRG